MAWHTCSGSTALIDVLISTYYNTRICPPDRTHGRAARAAQARSQVGSCDELAGCTTSGGRSPAGRLRISAAYAAASRSSAPTPAAPVQCGTTPPASSSRRPRLTVQPKPKTVGNRMWRSARFHRRSWTRANVGGRRSYGTLPAIRPCHVRSPAGLRSSVANAAPRRAVPNPRPSHRRRVLPAPRRVLTAALSTTRTTSGRAVRHARPVISVGTRVICVASRVDRVGNRRK
jgi:hypothetical protein